MTNNHSHFMLWMALWLMFMFTVVDCSGNRSHMQRQINDLDSEVHRLKDEAIDRRQENEVLIHNQDILERRIIQLESTPAARTTSMHDTIRGF
jgi:peptidoglycan hydrolase CwlO-like protein